MTIAVSYHREEPAASDPIVIQVYLHAGIAYWLNAWRAAQYRLPVCPDRRFELFELAMAAAIALFGFRSDAALATVVGVLVDVPVMLSVVRIVLRMPAWYQVRG